MAQRALHAFALLTFGAGVVVTRLGGDDDRLFWLGFSLVVAGALLLPVSYLLAARGRPWTTKVQPYGLLVFVLGVLGATYLPAPLWLAYLLLALAFAALAVAFVAKWLVHESN